MSLDESKVQPVLSSTKPPRAGTLSPAGLYNNNKDQYDFGSKMQKWVLSMPWTGSTDWVGEKY